jgi:hypothetical protein
LAGGLTLVDVLAAMGEAGVGVTLVVVSCVSVGDSAWAVMVMSLRGESGRRIVADNAAACGLCFKFCCS